MKNKTINMFVCRDYKRKWDKNPDYNIFMVDSPEYTRYHYCSNIAAITGGWSNKFHNLNSVRMSRRDFKKQFGFRLKCGSYAVVKINVVDVMRYDIFNKIEKCSCTVKKRTHFAA